MKVKVEKLDNFGRGIAHLNEKIVFIENALVGEEVDIEIKKETKKIIEGKVLDYHSTSPKRIKTLCPHYYVCGGCHLEHLSLVEENKFKEAKIKDILKKFADVTIPINNIIAKNAYFYRNKITLHVKNKKIGYYQDKTNELTEISNCPLANSKINNLLEPLKTLARDNDIEKIVIRSSNDEKQILLNLTGHIPNYKSILPLVDVLIINDKVLTKKSFINTNIGSKQYQISANSFFQVNKELTKNLYDEILAIVKENKYIKALDLYCGTGSIGLYLTDYIKEIIGIDYSKSNIIDANKNKLLNNSQNIKFFCAKVEDVITNYSNIDLIIVDPPRAGLDKKTIKTINTIEPQSIIYVSCDVVTLARDLKILKEKYYIKSIKPFNMFPRTYHVECICHLILQEN